MLKSQTKNSLTVVNELQLADDLVIEGKGKGRKFVSRFIEAGLAHYSEFGDILITKETLDKFINSMVGCPVIIKHKDITDKNADKERVGVVSNVWYDDKDGWFYCDGIIWDKQAIDLVKNQGWNVSCTYDFETDNKKGMYHGKEYDMQFTNGEFLHLALVDNPRYERANIVMNSKDTENGGEGSGRKPKGLKRIELENLEQKLKEEQEKNISEDDAQYNAHLKAIETYKKLIEEKQKDLENANNSKGDTIMTVLNELKDFIKSVVSNEKGEEMTDKRKLIDEVAGMMKSAGCDDEIIRTAIEKMEKIGYEKSEADTADNKCKNADEEEKEEKFEEEKEIAENKKAKNEEEEEKEKEEDKKEDEEKAENKCKNSMDEVREIVNNSFDVQVSSYVSRADRLKLGDNY